MTPTATLGGALARLAEKTFWTFVEVFLTTYAMADTIGASTAQAALSGGVAAALTLLVNSLPDAPVGLPFRVDLGYRVVRTFAVSTLGAMVSINVFDWSVDGWRIAALAAVPAVAAVLKGAVAGLVGNRDTAATLPASVDEQPHTPLED